MAVTAVLFLFCSCASLVDFVEAVFQDAERYTVENLHHYIESILE